MHSIRFKTNELKFFTEVVSAIKVTSYKDSIKLNSFLLKLKDINKQQKIDSDKIIEEFSTEEREVQTKMGIQKLKVVPDDKKEIVGQKIDNLEYRIQFKENELTDLVIFFNFFPKKFVDTNGERGLNGEDIINYIKIYSILKYTITNYQFNGYIKYLYKNFIYFFMNLLGI